MVVTTDDEDPASQLIRCCSEFFARQKEKEAVSVAKNATGVSNAVTPANNNSVVGTNLFCDSVKEWCVVKMVGQSPWQRIAEVYGPCTEKAAQQMNAQHVPKYENTYTPGVRQCTEYLVVLKMTALK